jgi:hypothetical protein
MRCRESGWVMLCFVMELELAFHYLLCIIYRNTYSQFLYYHLSLLPSSHQSSICDVVDYGTLLSCGENGCFRMFAMGENFAFTIWADSMRRACWYCADTTASPNLRNSYSTQQTLPTPTFPREPEETIIRHQHMLKILFGGERPSVKMSPHMNRGRCIPKPEVQTFPSTHELYLDSNYTVSHLQTPYSKKVPVEVYRALSSVMRLSATWGHHKTKNSRPYDWYGTIPRARNNSSNILPPFGSWDAGRSYIYKHLLHFSLMRISPNQRLGHRSTIITVARTSLRTGRRIFVFVGLISSHAGFTCCVTGMQGSV